MSKKKISNKKLLDALYALYTLHCGDNKPTNLQMYDVRERISDIFKDKKETEWVNNNR